MTEKQYYSEKKVSSTSLKWFEDESPWYFKNMLDKEIVQEKLSWFDTGRQIHMSILEPKEFDINYIYLDYKIPKSENQKKFCEIYIDNINKYTDKERRILSYERSYNAVGKSEDKINKESEKLYNTLQSYIKYLEKSKEYKEVLTKSKWKLIQDLKKEAYNHKKARQLLLVENDLANVEEYNEIPIFWEYKTIEGKTVPCKSMLDRLVIDHDTKTIKLIDLKTTSNLGTFHKSVDKYKYYRQLAFYWKAVEYEFKDLQDYKRENYIIALRTKELPECKVFEISNNLIELGNEEIKNLMKDISWHFENNFWKYSREYYEGTGVEKLKEEN